MENQFKSLLGGVGLLLLLFPMLQGSVHFFEEGALGGYVENGEMPVLTWENWRSGEFQLQYDSLLDANMGMRNGLIRLHNQYQWDLFRRHNARKIQVGKSDFLFENQYLNSYMGWDFKEAGPTEKRAVLFKEVQDTLANHGIDFLVVFAPSKVAYYPEYIPDSYAPWNRGPTHYDILSQRLPELGVNLVDMDAWFRDIKAETRHPLFPKSGIHWSFYGAYLAADSLLHKLEADRGHPLPKMVLDSLLVSQRNWGSDYDMGKSLNLLFHRNTFPLAYPLFHYAPQKGQYKPKTLFISDSFFYTFRKFKFQEQALGGGHFWYYNEDNSSFPPSPERKVSHMDLKETVLKHDQVIVMVTVANLATAPWGFNEDVLKVFESPFEHRIQHFSAAILRDPKLLAEVEAKATAQGRTLAEMIRLDATWLTRNEAKQRTLDSLQQALPH